MTADLEQRAFDAAYAELSGLVTDQEERATVARALTTAVTSRRRARVAELALDVNRTLRANFLFAWGFSELYGLRDADVDAAVAAAARVLAEEG